MLVIAQVAQKNGGSTEKICRSKYHTQFDILSKVSHLWVWR